jgi:hypothetical protein
MVGAEHQRLRAEGGMSGEREVKRGLIYRADALLGRV